MSKVFNDQVFRHEVASRGSGSLERIAGTPTWIFGCGALGSNIAVNLVRSGFTHIGLSDFDKVESHNINTQAYSMNQFGLNKVQALESNLCDIIGGLDIQFSRNKLETSKDVIKALKPFPPNVIMLDCFDNAAGRGLLYNTAIAQGLDHLLHVGVNGDFGEVKWNERYIVPTDAGEDICDYPLASTFVQFMASIATEILIRYVLTGVKECANITFKDFKVMRS